MKAPLMIGVILFLIGQILIWYQTNSQFFSTWAKEHPGILALLGFPISYFFIKATRYVVEGFDGLVWPSRLIGFGTGVIVFGVLAYLHLGQAPTLKTWVTIGLALAIVSIQIFWK